MDSGREDLQVQQASEVTTKTRLNTKMRLIKDVWEEIFCFIGDPYFVLTTLAALSKECRAATWRSVCKIYLYDLTPNKYSYEIRFGIIKNWTTTSPKPIEIKKEDYHTFSENNASVSVSASDGKIECHYRDWKTNLSSSDFLIDISKKISLTRANASFIYTISNAHFIACATFRGPDIGNPDRLIKDIVILKKDQGEESKYHLILKNRPHMEQRDIERKIKVNKGLLTVVSDDNKRLDIYQMTTGYSSSFESPKKRMEFHAYWMKEGQVFVHFKKQKLLSRSKSDCYYKYDFRPKE